MSDHFDLQRFINAQEPIYSLVVSELKNQQKKTHWMWFIFPQIIGLGYSEMSRYYGLAGIDEARSYWRHPILGPRLRQCTECVLASSVELQYLFASPDDLKFYSSITLFQQTREDELFERVLRRYFSGIPDEKTIELIK